MLYKLNKKCIGYEIPISIAIRSGFAPAKVRRDEEAKTY